MGDLGNRSPVHSFKGGSMASKIVKSKANRVFLCRVGHISNEATKYKNYFACTKIRTNALERSEVVCKNVTVIVSEFGLRRVHKRAWVGGIHQAVDFVSGFLTHELR